MAKSETAVWVDHHNDDGWVGKCDRDGRTMRAMRSTLPCVGTALGGPRGSMGIAQAPEQKPSSPPPSGRHNNRKPRQLSEPRGRQTDRPPMRR
jgi:hypothetical protein